MSATLRILLFCVLALPALAQNEATDYAPEHLCSRCHLNDTLEWSISGHSNSGTECTSCHGPSEGHLIDERNNIKPDQVPRGAAIATLCQSCHSDGCSTTDRKDCQGCHHVHALVDMSQPGDSAAVHQAEEREKQDYEDAMTDGRKLADSGRYRDALARYQDALRLWPDDESAGARIAFCKRRIDPSMPGFRIDGDGFDTVSGLPSRVEVSEVGMRMSLVPGGEADIGDAQFPAAKLVHTVSMEPFYLGQREVTQAQWQQVMGDNPSHFGKGSGEAAKMPADSITWEEAQEFVRRLNELVPGGGFRLPTEAEWEFAARAGGTGDVAAQAWYLENSCVQEREPRQEPIDYAAPRPVGSKESNKLGLYDLAGNVWEWCSSLLRPYPYDASDGREDLSAKGLRVLRGGGFADPADLLNPAFRHGERPTRRIRWNGLRIARTAPR